MQQKWKFTPRAVEFVGTLSRTDVHAAGTRPDAIGRQATILNPAARHPRKTTHLGLFAWLAAFMLAYINLVPFDYRAVPFAEAVDTFRHLHWQDFINSDRARWFSNVLQFAPFGYCACGALGRRSRAFGILTAGLLGASLAIGLEFAQIWVPPRTVALDDIVAEVTGTALGIACWLIAGVRITRTVQTAISGGPDSVVAALYVYLGVYAVVFLHPFDFVLTPEEIGADSPMRMRSHGRRFPDLPCTASHF